MNRILKTVLVAVMTLLASQAVKAQDASIRNVGYTITDQIDVNGAAFGQAGTYTVGALLTPMQLEYYKDCRVLGIRVAVANNPGRSRVYMNKLVGNNLSEVNSQYQRLYEGWNEIYFNGDGYTVEGTESLLFGYDYVETDEMVTADEGGMCAVGEDTANAFMLYQNNGLYQINGVGKLCVQLIMDVSALPTEKLAMAFFDTGFKYKKMDEGMEIFCILQNTGREDITSLTMSYSVDDATSVEVPLTLEAPIASGAQQTWQQVIDLPADIKAGGHTLTVRASSINGVTPTQGSDALTQATFALYENSLSRSQVFVEVYASQDSYNSANLDKYLKTLKNDVGKDLCLVQAHAPGTSLSVKDAEYLHGLYAYTLPSFTVNRSWFPGEAHVAYDLNDYFQTLPDVMIDAILADIVMQDLMTPSFANVKLTTDYDAASRLLTVNASGEALPEAGSIYGDIALTLMLVEDGVTDSQSVLNAMGQVKKDNSYTHDDVLRGFMTPATGQTVEIKDGKFAGEYSITLPDGFDATKMRVVGILTKAMPSVTAADLRAVDVIDANSAKVSDGSGIHAVGSDSTKRQVEGYYTMDGRRMATAPANGLYIIRYTDGKAVKVMK